MALLLILFVTLIHPKGAFADARVKSCVRKLVDVRPSFQPDLRLSAKEQIAVYRGQSIKLARQQYLLLQMILLNEGNDLSPESVAAELWTEKHFPRYRLHIRSLRSQIKRKFKTVDPSFARLDERDRLHWAREDLVLIAAGRIAVSEKLGLGFADGTPVRLSKSEAAHLRHLLRTGSLNLDQPTTQNLQSLRRGITLLNQKFESLVRGKVFRSAGYGKTRYVLNPDLD